MLGQDNKPSLLVIVGQEYSPTHFEFYVINGSWDGTYNNGHITVWMPDSPFSDLDLTEILTDNQSRLGCKRQDYNDVFNNFSNPDYVYDPDLFDKEYQKWLATQDDLEDDIPF
jgi:hypothetical protein